MTGRFLQVAKYMWTIQGVVIILSLIYVP